MQNDNVKCKIAVTFILTILLAWPLFVYAQNSKTDNINFTPQVTIPGPDGTASSPFTKAQQYIMDGTTKPICDYILAIYKYIIGIVGILAAMTMIIGAAIWLTSGGNSGRIGEAKSWMVSSLLGLLLALGAYLLLATISENLIICRIHKIAKVGYVKSTPDKTGNTFDHEACMWLPPTAYTYQRESVTEGSCPSGFVKKSNNYCEQNARNYDAILHASLVPNTSIKDIAIGCCCVEKQNSALAQANYCQDKEEGTTCIKNNNWGFCEKIAEGYPNAGQMACKQCKQKSSTGINPLADPSFHQVFTPAEAHTMTETQKCYHNNLNWECPDSRSVCGSLAVDGNDCVAYGLIHELPDGFRYSTFSGGMTSTCWNRTELDKNRNEYKALNDKEKKYNYYQAICICKES